MNGFEYAIDTLIHSGAVPAAMAGVAWGIIGGALPGISASIAMALLLPFTYAMSPTPAIILLAATYVGAEYGGSIPAILIRTPGTGAAAATVIDGYEMHMKGRGGEALGISLVSGVIGGLLGLIVLVGLTKPLSSLALLFTPPAYFALGVLGISVVASLSSGSLVKGLIAAVFGLMISTIGLDPLSGVGRFTFGIPDLLGGVDYVLILVGLFALSELWHQSAQSSQQEKANGDSRLKLPGRATLRRIWKFQIVGAVIGIFEGCMPAAGGTVASFLAYNEARRWSKHREEFGHGAVEGVAAPEAANNAVASTSLVPTLTFGIPGSNSTAVLLGGLILHGLDPGPLLISKNPEVVYGLFGGLFVANLSLLFIGMLILTPAVWLVNRPKPYLLACVYVLIVSGAYSIHNTTFDLWILLGAGALGYAMRLLSFPALPMVLGVILGHMMEANFRRSLVLSNGSIDIFVKDWISLTLLGVAALFVVGSLWRDFRDRSSIDTSSDAVDKAA